MVESNIFKKRKKISNPCIQSILTDRIDDIEKLPNADTDNLSSSKYNLSLSTDKIQNNVSYELKAFNESNLKNYKIEYEMIKINLVSCSLQYKNLIKINDMKINNIQSLKNFVDSQIKNSDNTGTNESSSTTTTNYKRHSISVSSTAKMNDLLEEDITNVYKKRKKKEKTESTLNGCNINLTLTLNLNERENSKFKRKKLYDSTNVDSEILDKNNNDGQISKTNLIPLMKNIDCLKSDIQNTSKANIEEVTNLHETLKNNIFIESNQIEKSNAEKRDELIFENKEISNNKKQELILLGHKVSMNEEDKININEHKEELDDLNNEFILKKKNLIQKLNDLNDLNTLIIKCKNSPKMRKMRKKMTLKKRSLQLKLL